MSNEPLLGLTLRKTINNKSNNYPLLGTPPATTYKRSGFIGAVKNAFLKPLTHEPQRKQRLLEAIKKGDTEEAIRIIQTSGIDVNVVLDKTHNNNALILASKSGHLDIVNALVAKEANVNAVNSYGHTALIIASYFGHLDIVNALVAVPDINVNAANEDGQTALITASKSGHLEIVNALIAKGADVNAVNSDGDTALMCASKSGHLEIVNALIAAGAKNRGLFSGGRTRKNRVKRRKSTRHRR